MSRIGKKSIEIPSGVEFSQTPEEIIVKGPKGTLKEALHSCVRVLAQDNTVTCSVLHPENKDERALWGLYGALIRNMILGVTVGFSKQLEVRGIGYKCKVEGKKLILDVGFSHEVVFSVPDEITVTTDKSFITVAGASKQQVGLVASQIRKIRKPESYKGKGIRYINEVVAIKAGKAAKTAAAK